MRPQICAISAMVIFGAISQPSNASPFNCGGTCYRVATYAGNTTASDTSNFLDIATSTSSTATYFRAGPPMLSMTASSSVDLARGSIRADASTNYAGGANGSLYEVVKFDLPTGMLSADIPVTWVVDGITNFITGSPNGLGAQFSIAGQNGDRVSFGSLDPRDPFVQSMASNGSHHFVFHDVLTVDEIQRFQISSFLLLGINGSGSLDYGNTSYFNFALPTGVSLISSSGVLLSNPIGVPEPSAWALLIIGFALTGSAMRWRTLSANR